MRVYDLMLALIVCHWSLVHAQQACYWPDGSDASINGTANCNSNQDSICCFDDDVCMDNDLCFSTVVGLVCSNAPVSAVLYNSSGPSETSQILNEYAKVYRGACTVKDWTKSTVCRNDLCPASKVFLFFFRSNV